MEDGHVLRVVAIWPCTICSQPCCDPCRGRIRISRDPVVSLRSTTG